MATIYLDSINKSFGSLQVLQDIELSIQDKEFVVFVGPSGCGKSTLLRIIAGLEEATSGRIFIDDQDVSRETPLNRGISMVFQSYALYPHLSVFENIAFPLRVQKTPQSEVKRRVEAVAETLQLTDRLQLKPKQLSGGQRQRVAIGRSIIREPKIFLFDEPLSNLDATLRGQMRVELSQLHLDLNTTMIYVTHDQVEAMTMADRIAVLNKGRIEQIGSPMELYHHPRTKFVAQFIGQPSMNFVAGEISEIKSDGVEVELESGGRLLLPAATNGAAKGDKVEVGIRPEDFSIGDGLAVHVRILERLGGSSIVYGSLADDSPICASLEGNASVEEGQSVSLTFNPEDAHIFKMNGEVLRRQSAPQS